MSSPSEFPSAEKPPTRRLTPNNIAVGGSSGGSFTFPPDDDGSGAFHASPKPERIGRYEIIREVGRGGMGIVYEARDPTLQRTVALKMILGTRQGDFQNWARFAIEARALGQLQHPNIVQLHEFGNESGQLYFTLEYIDGGSLKARISELSPRAAAALIVPLAEAIHVAHQKGVIHRDLKPGNILMTAAGQPKIVDFGLAKLRHDAANHYAEEAGPLTDAGDVLGTPQYMAPEQAKGLNNLIGPATDVYALGAILYELLTGRPPFEGAKTMQTLMAVMHDEPRPPRRLNPKVPRDLETICCKCLHKEPWRRYGSGADLAADLRRFLAGETIQARTPNPAERGWRWVRRHPAVAVLLCLVVLVTALGFAGIVWQWQRAEERAEAEAEARRDAKRQEENAVQARNAAENALYYSRILQIQHEYGANNVPQALQLLDLCRPAAGMPDRRGWEWHYLNRICHPELKTLVADSGLWAWGVAFSRDGSMLATAAGSPYGDTSKNPGRLVLWNAATLQPIGTLEGHQGSVQNMTFSPDGQLLLSVSLDHTARLWNVAARRQLWQTSCWTFSYGAGPAIFTADGKSAIVALSENSSRRVDCATGKETDLEGRVVGSDARGRIALYRPDKSECVFLDAANNRDSLGCPNSPLALSPDGQTLAAFAGSELQIQDLLNKTRRPVNPGPGAVYGIAFSPDGAWLATGGADRVVRIWDVAKGELVREYRGHPAPVRSVAFQADGTRLASSDQLGRVKLWDLTRDPVQQRLPQEVPADGIGSLGFRKEGSRSLLLVDTHHLLRSWDAVSGCLVKSIPGPMPGRTMYPRWDRVFSSDGRLFCAPVTATPNQIKVWDAITGRETLALTGAALPVHCVNFSADGRRLATAGFRGEVRAGNRVLIAEPATVWDAATGRALSMAKPGTAMFVTLSPDGKRAATAEGVESASRIRFYDADTGRELWNQPGHHGALTRLAFSPDGNWLASVGFNEGGVKLWNVADGTATIFEQAPLGRRTLTSVAFTPDGKRLAAVGYDGDVHLWDTASGSAVLTLRCPGGPRPDDFGFCPQLAFSPDGLLASNDWKSIVSIWDGRAENADSGVVRPDGNDLLAWHEQQAKASERTGRTFSAEFHRKQLQPRKGE